MFASQLNLSGNQLCGIDVFGNGTYTTEGIIALADALKVTASLTELNLDGYALPIKQLKGTEPVASLDFRNKGLGVPSAIVIASLIGDNASMTWLDVRHNLIGEEGKAALHEAIEGRSGFELLL